MTVEQARKLAARVNLEIEEGSNPAQVKRIKKGEPTFAELFKEYGERHGTKQHSWATDQSLYSNPWQSLGALKITAISRESLFRIRSGMEKAGLAGSSINGVRALLSSIFGRAIEWGYATANPVIGSKTRRTVRRDRVLHTGE